MVTCLRNRAVSLPAEGWHGHRAASASHLSCTCSAILASSVAGAWLSVPRWGGIRELSATARTEAQRTCRGAPGLVVHRSGRAAGVALVGRRAMERVCATAIRRSAGTSAPYPGAAGSASSGHGIFRQEHTGGHQQQGGPQDDMAYTPDLAYATANRTHDQQNRHWYAQSNSLTRHPHMTALGACVRCGAAWRSGPDRLGRLPVPVEKRP